DFCEFYAREMLRLAAPPPLTPVPGEKNTLRYVPLGVGVVIPPWNFPLAILAGMTAASIVAGNTVVLKPSSDSPAIGYKFVSAFGFQGQKCSACSRAIVVEKVYDAFLDKLKARVERIKVGPAANEDVYMGPVVNANAKKSILKYIEIGKKEGRLITGGAEAPG